MQHFGTSAITCIFSIQVKFYERCKLVVIFLVGVARRGQACPKCAKITEFQYLNNDLSYCFYFMHTRKVPWELQINCHIFGGGGWVCPEMHRVCQYKDFSILSNGLSHSFDIMHVNKVLWNMQINYHILDGRFLDVFFFWSIHVLLVSSSTFHTVIVIFMSAFKQKENLVSWGHPSVTILLLKIHLKKQNGTRNSWSDHLFCFSHIKFFNIKLIWFIGKMGWKNLLRAPRLVIWLEKSFSKNCRVLYDITLILISRNYQTA